MGGSGIKGVMLVGYHGVFFIKETPDIVSRRSAGLKYQ